MKKNRRKWMIFAAVVTLLVLAVGLTQLYLKDNLVVAVEESHHHAHVEDSGSDESDAETVASENLVTNYSFEVGSDLDLYGWKAEGEDVGTGIWRDQEVSAYGFSSAAMLARDTSLGTDLVLTQSLREVPSGKDVTIKGSVKTEGLHGDAFLRVTGDTLLEQSINLVVWFDLNEVTGTTDWRTVEGSVYLPPEVVSASVAVGIYGEGAAWFDEVSLTASDHVPAPLPRDVNLLKNPDFTQSTLHWHFFSVPETPKAEWGVRDSGGANGPNLFLTQPSPVDQYQYSGFYQVVNGLDRSTDLATLSGWLKNEGLEGDRSTDLATLSGWLKTEGLEGEAWLNLNFYGLDGKAVGETQRALTGSQGWEYLEITVQVPANAESVWVRLIFNGTGTAAFDDIDFRLTPLQ